jgi:hypothetical protein
MWRYLTTRFLINPLLGHVESKAGTPESRFPSEISFDSVLA